MHKLLVIDDEYLVRRGIRETIPWREHGIEIVGEASNGKEGLKLALESRPDVVICDVRMPVMDGAEFVREARAAGLDCAILILSGYKEFDYAKETLEGGAFAYLLKPTENEELLQAVIAALERLKESRRLSASYAQLQSVLPAVGQALLLDLISGGETAAARARDVMQTHGYSFAESGYVVCVQVDQDVASGDVAAALRGYLTELTGLLAERSLDWISTALESSLVLLVEGKVRVDALKELCEKALDRYEHLGFREILTLGVSRPYTGLDGVAAAYAQAKAAAGTKLFPLLHGVLLFGERESPYRPQVTEAMRYIAEHYHENVTVKAVADALYVSESYLMHLFRENVGLTFNECLTAYRMLMARKMLREGKLRVYEIARLVGYSDPKYFSQTFRKHFGLPPSQYDEVAP